LAQVVGSTATYTIVGATDVTDDTVTVYIKGGSGVDHTSFVDEVTATRFGTTNDFTFTYTARADACLTSAVAYKTPGNIANNDLIDDGVKNGSATAASGIAFVDALTDKVARSCDENNTGCDDPQTVNETDDTLVLGSITGQKWEDHNGNGVQDAGDDGIPNWTINLHGAGLDGIWDNGDDVSGSTTTDGSGNYEFSDLSAGDYVVSEADVAGWTHTTVTSYNVTLTADMEVTGTETSTVDCTTTITTFTTTTVSSSSDNDFGNFKNIDICGMKYEDTTGNGFSNDDPVLNTSDPHYVTVTVNLYKNGDTTPFATTSTGSDGTYCFTDLGPGTYTVSEVVPAGWTKTAETGATITASSGQDSNGNNFDDFKNIQICGTKFLDHNGSGSLVKDVTNNFLGGFTIHLYQESNNTLGLQVGTGGDTLITSHGTGVTDVNGAYCFTNLGPGTYYVQEDASTQTDPSNWIQSGGPTTYYTEVAASGTNVANDNFANLHLTTHNGLTIGFYTNQNGQALLCNPGTTKLKDCVYNALYAAFNNTGTSSSQATPNGTSVLVNEKGAYIKWCDLAGSTGYTTLQNFLKKATSTNMANMLSAQLTATVLNCYFSSTTGVSVTESIDVSKVTLVGTTSGQTNAQIIAGLQAGGTGTGVNANPGLTLVTDTDTTDKFIDIQSLINAAVQELKTHPNTTATSADRTFQESLKNCFDAINNREDIFLS